MGRSKQWCVLASLLAALSGCGEVADEHEPEDELGQVIDYQRTTPTQWLDVRRSLAVTEQEILQRFSLQRVMNQLARDTRIKGLTGIDLFRQWWDTQNPRPGLGRGAHCDDEVNMLGTTMLNGFPYDCRPSPMEGAQAACRSFNDPACRYIPIGLFNRFDLAPPDGSHCGEHRIVYAKETGQTDRRDRNLVIFEAVLPNPFPWLGVQGCRGLIEQWAELSWIDSMDRRADRLERMYFDGSWFFPPVVRFANYGDNARGLGQIRTNQFMGETSPAIWTMREFKLTRECSRRDGCRALVVPVTVKNNPIGMLFGDPDADPRVGPFQARLVGDNTESLAGTTLTDISMNTENMFNSGQSHSSGSDEMDFATPFATQREGLRKALWRALGRIGSDITPEQLVERARTQTCGGCHQLSNNKELGGGLIWPPSLGFVHVSEVDPERYGRTVRFRISPLLTTSFLPTRARIMSDFLQDKPWRKRGWWAWTVGGRFTH